MSNLKYLPVFKVLCKSNSKNLLVFKVSRGEDTQVEHLPRVSRERERERERGGWTKKRPVSDHVILGPMRGLEINIIERGHSQSKQISQLLDQLGPQVELKKKIFFVFTDLFNGLVKYSD